MRVSLVNILIISGTLALALLVTLLGARLIRWRRDVALRRHAAPVLVVPLSQPPAGMRPPATREIFPDGEVFPQRRSPLTVRPVTPGAASTRPPWALEEDLQYVTESETMRERPTQPTQRIEDAEHTVESSSEATPIFEGRKIRFVQAEEGTLEFLPGRLEVVAGEDTGQEIHFARLLGETETTVTFGRSEGPALRHIQLLDPTVSRTHARMNFAGGRWYLHNLSHTNAVILNGAPLPDHGDGITLEDGDRIEMGAVVFVFHAR